MADDFAKRHNKDDETRLQLAELLKQQLAKALTNVQEEDEEEETAVAASTPTKK